MQKTKYKRINTDEREEISRFLAAEKSLAEIARELDRHPASPWERGTNENTNGLIRQYFPKGMDFTKVSVDDIKQVQQKLNDRPRAVLGYMKPDKVINDLVALIV